MINILEKEAEITAAIQCILDACNKVNLTVDDIVAKEQIATAIVDGITDESVIETVFRAINSEITPPNLDPNSGTFTDRVNNAIFYSTDPVPYLDYGDLVGSYNGSQILDGGAFLNNNTDYGGTSGNMHARIITLMTHFLNRGRSNARYGSTFNQARIDAGEGVLSPKLLGGVTKYRMNATNAVMVAKVQTVAYWIQCTANSVFVSATKKDGVWLNAGRTSQTIEITSADGVTHIVDEAGENFGYGRLINVWGDNDGVGGLSRIYIALAYVSTGKVNIMPDDHVSPIPSAIMR